MHTRPRRKTAFTLVELAIVLVIMGLIIGLTLPIVTDFIKHEKSVAAKDFMTKIKNEIIGYALINKVLPTSLSDLGVEKDPYGNTIIYVADSGMTGTDLCSSSLADGMQVDKVNPGGTDSFTDIAFVLISPGRNNNLETTNATNTDFTVTDPRTYGTDGQGFNYDDVVEFVSYNYLRNKVCTNTATESFVPRGSDVSFGKNIADFSGQATGISPPGSSSGAVSVDLEAGTVTLGDGTGSGDAGCVWYQGSEASGNCTNGTCDFDDGFRAFFTFKHVTPDTSGDSKTAGDGFTFAVVQATDNTPADCGISGARLAYSGTGGAGDGSLAPPKLGVEIDAFPNDGDAWDTQLLPTDARNHLAVVYWGATRDNDNQHNATVSTPNAYTNAGLTTQARNPANAALENGVYIPASVTEWEDGFEYSVRVEANRTIEDAVQHIYRYDIKTWIRDCATADCTTFSDLTADYTDTTAPYANSTIYYDNDLGSFDRILFGWTVSSFNSQEITIADFGFRFR
ncbi:type II secretory pathway pseudopilin PulG [Desulfobaculum xiamenense]|uniref:Type II secretory pathway pseudopilin PulG n=1 Tax=Desulfobaculum xiamenense TaxID=995050 RepID=A0A846QNM3_9BACT|nr:type II secretory pathway pseudopilin PulG [Desulfobaculum xiamenense]